MKPSASDILHENIDVFQGLLDAHHEQWGAAVAPRLPIRFMPDEMQALVNDLAVVLTVIEQWAKA